MFKYIILFGFDKRKLEYHDKETVIRNGFSPPPVYYIRLIFCYLRKNMELTANREYKRLYKETLNYLIHHAIIECKWKPWKIRQNRKSMEHLSDIYNSLPDSPKYTEEQVNEFLEYRRMMWY